MTQLRTWYTFEPMADRSWIDTASVAPTQFRAKLPDTLKLLRTEIDAVTAIGSLGDPIIQLDVDRDDLRLDGGLRAKTRPRTGAVAVSFMSQHGPLMFRCDQYVTSHYNQGEAWHHNLRAIALTLQSLRAVARYGATASGEQYAGFRQIEAGNAGLPVDQAQLALRKWLVLIPDQRPTEADWRAALRRARRDTHPDRLHGSREAWDLVERAARALGLEGT